MSFYGKNRIPLNASLWYTAGTILLALLLTILLSPWHFYVPPFMAWVIAWWSIRNPKRMSLTVCFIIGFLVDVIHDQILGTSILNFLMIGYFLTRIRFRFEQFSFLQQSIVITSLFMVARSIPLLLNFFLSAHSFNVWMFFPQLLGGILWVPFSLIIVWSLYRPIKDVLSPHQTFRNRKQQAVLDNVKPHSLDS